MHECANESIMTFVPAKRFMCKGEGMGIDSILEHTSTLVVRLPIFLSTGQHSVTVTQVTETIL